MNFDRQASSFILYSAKIMKINDFINAYIFSFIIMFTFILSSINSDLFLSIEVSSIPYGEFWVIPLIIVIVIIFIYSFILSFYPKFICTLERLPDKKIAFIINDDPPININYPFNWSLYYSKFRTKGLKSGKLYLVIDDGEFCIILSEFLRPQDSVPKISIPVDQFNVMSEGYYEYSQTLFPIRLKKLGQILEDLDNPDI